MGTATTPTTIIASSPPATPQADERPAPAPRIPEWRRRALEQQRLHGNVAVADITGAVRL